MLAVAFLDRLGVDGWVGLADAVSEPRFAVGVRFVVEALLELAAALLLRGIRTGVCLDAVSESPFAVHVTVRIIDAVVQLSEAVIRRFEFLVAEISVVDAVSEHRLAVLGPIARIDALLEHGDAGIVGVLSLAPFPVLGERGFSRVPIDGASAQGDGANKNKPLHDFLLFLCSSDPVRGRNFPAGDSFAS